MSDQIGPWQHPVPPGYQQPPTWQNTPPGQPPGQYGAGGWQQPPPKKGNGLLWAILIGLVVVIAACGVFAFIALSGGDDDKDDTSAGGIPTDASQQEFCGSFLSALTFDAQAPAQDQADDLHALAAKMKSTGTPSDIPADARTGFEDTIEALEAVTAEDIESGNYTDPSDMAATDSAFADYLLTTCSDSLPIDGLPSGAVPTESG